MLIASEKIFDYFNVLSKLFFEIFKKFFKVFEEKDRNQQRKKHGVGKRLQRNQKRQEFPFQCSKR